MSARRLVRLLNPMENSFPFVWPTNLADGAPSDTGRHIESVQTLTRNSRGASTEVADIRQRCRAPDIFKWAPAGA